MSNSFFPLSDLEQSLVLKSLITVWTIYCINDLLRALFLDIKNGGFRRTKHIPFVVLCITPIPVLVMFWLHGLLDSAITYKGLALTERLYVLAEVNIFARRVPFQLMSKQAAYIIKTSMGLLVFFSLFDAILAIVSLAEGPTNYVTVFELVSVCFASALSGLHQIAAWKITHDLQIRTTNETTAIALKLLCEICIRILLASILAVCRALTDDFMFTATVIIAGSYALEQYGALFRAKNAGFVDSEWKGSRKSNAQTLKRDLAPANCSRAFAVLEKANLGTASTLAPKKDFVAS